MWKGGGHASVIPSKGLSLFNHIGNLSVDHIYAIYHMENVQGVGVGRPMMSISNHNLVDISSVDICLGFRICEDNY